MPSPKTPDCFSGKSGEPPKVKSWVKSMDDYFSLYPALTDEARKAFALTLLCGPALLVVNQYDRIAVNDPTQKLQTWTQLDAALLDQFS